MKFGLSDDVWASAKAEAKEAIVRRARAGNVVFYSDLVEEIQSVELQPRDPRLAALLDEISTEEDSAGHGMLSALVVLKESYQPGQGFFNLARSRGKDVSSPDAFLVQETKKVMRYWASQSG
jgi:hypothetical protein